MSQPWQQPPASNPYGQPQAAYPPPAPAPGAYPPAGAYPPPVAPIPRRPDRLGPGILAALGAALGAVLLYAAILRFTDHEIGYVALAVGLMVGAAMGKTGGRDPLLPVLGVVFSLLAVWFGQLVGIAWIVSHHEGIPFAHIFFGEFGTLVRAWKTGFVDAKDILFFAIAGVEGYVVTRRAGNSV